MRQLRRIRTSSAMLSKPMTVMTKVIDRVAKRTGQNRCGLSVSESTCSVMTSKLSAKRDAEVEDRYK